MILYHGSKQKFDCPNINKFQEENLKSNDYTFGVYFLYCREQHPLMYAKAKDYALRDSSKGYIYQYELSDSDWNNIKNKLLRYDDKMSYDEFYQLFNGYELFDADLKQCYNSLSNNSEIITCAVGFYSTYKQTKNWENIAHELVARLDKVGLIHGTADLGTVILWNPKYYYNINALNLLTRTVVAKK